MELSTSDVDPKRHPVLEPLAVGAVAAGRGIYAAMTAVAESGVALWYLACYETGIWWRNRRARGQR